MNPGGGVLPLGGIVPEGRCGIGRGGGTVIGGRGGSGCGLYQMGG